MFGKPGYWCLKSAVSKKRRSQKIAKKKSQEIPNTSTKPSKYISCDISIENITGINSDEDWYRPTTLLTRRKRRKLENDETSNNSK